MGPILFAIETLFSIFLRLPTVKNWTELTSNLDDSVTRNHRLVAEEILDKKFLPLFLSGPDDLSVKNRMSRILNFLLGERLVHPAELGSLFTFRIFSSYIKVPT